LAAAIALTRVSGPRRSARAGEPCRFAQPWEVAAWLEFIRQPTAVNRYRAHNVSVIGAYLEHGQLASGESRLERFFLTWC
jgi:hypothetical protein